MTTCPLCGSDNPSDARSCSNCGTKLVVDESTHEVVEPGPEKGAEAIAEGSASEETSVEDPSAGEPIDIMPVTEEQAVEDQAANTQAVERRTEDGQAVGDQAADDEIVGGELPDDEAAASTAEHPTDPEGLVLRQGELVLARRYMVLRCTSSGPERNEYVAVDRERWLCQSCEVAMAMDVDECLQCKALKDPESLEHPEVRLLEAFDGGELRWASAVSDAEVEHPGLTVVHDAFEHTPYGTEPRCYAVTDPAGGRRLSEMKPPLGPRQVMIWGAQLAEALAALHAAGLSHGSVRASAVRVVDDDVVLDGFERVQPITLHDRYGVGATGATEPVVVPAPEGLGETTGDSEAALGPQPETPAAVRSDIVALGALLQSLLPRKGAPPQVTELIARAIVVVPGRAFATAESFASALGETARQMAADAPDVLLMSGHASHVGRARDLNEDSLLVVEAHLNQLSTPRSVGLYAIADGMGGHSSGEVASGLAVRELAASAAGSLVPLAAESSVDAAECEALLVDACRAAGLAVYDARQAADSDMGATLVSALVVDGEVFMAHAGDSRAYRITDSGIEALTTDHTLVQQWVDQGQMSADEARSHPRRNLIYRQVGEGPDVGFDVNRALLLEGDWLVLCSDGLSGMVKDAEILSVVTSGLDPQDACDELVLRANQAGGDDNISVVAVTVRSTTES